MTRASATERRLYDLFNVTPEPDRLANAINVLVASGTRRADAENIATGAYARWLVASQPMMP